VCNCSCRLVLVSRAESLARLSASLRGAASLPRVLAIRDACLGFGHKPKEAHVSHGSFSSGLTSANVSGVSGAFAETKDPVTVVGLPDWGAGGTEPTADESNSGGDDTGGLESGPPSTDIGVAAIGWLAGAGGVICGAPLCAALVGS
jgi:hypothetical protein